MMGSPTYLIGESGCGEISQRELESSITPLDIHLQSDQSIEICR